MNRIAYTVPALMLAFISLFEPVAIMGSEPSTGFKPAVAEANDYGVTNNHTAIELPENFQYPNGIAHSSDGTLYVGSVTSGQILRIAPDGTTEPFFSGSEEIFAATSLRLDETRGILWGTSPDFLGIRGTDGAVTQRPHRIFAIDTRSGELLQVIPLPDGGFGNDMVIDPSGGVYVTDSTHPRIHYLAPGATELQTWIENEQFQSEEIGLAGIARHSSGVLVVGKYSDGELFKITPQSQGDIIIEPIILARELENPDGMQFAPDGSLLVIEGSVQSGNGRLLRLDVLSPTTEPRVIETLVENMESPVNLTIVGQELWVSEARIRHRLLPRKENNVPNQFFIHRFTLPFAQSFRLIG